MQMSTRFPDLDLSIGVHDRRDIRQGWRVSLTALPKHDWNALGQCWHQSFHRTLKAANREASALAAEYGVPFTPRAE
jgi:hypothetical protein